MSVLLLKVRACHVGAVPEAGLPLDESASALISPHWNSWIMRVATPFYILFSQRLAPLSFGPHPTIHTTVVTEQTAFDPPKPQTHTSLPRTPRHYHPPQAVLWASPLPPPLHRTQSTSSCLLT